MSAKTATLSDTAIIVLARACRSHIAGTDRDCYATIRRNELPAVRKLAGLGYGEISGDLYDGAVFLPSATGLALFPSIDDRASTLEDERAGR